MPATELIAARYAWLRQNPAWETEMFLGGLSPEEFDAAVDKAMANEAFYKAEAARYKAVA